ncbi:LemA family protein [Luteolibacter marinus]|uniref:LemA family protein n=1 Tax=Luteolibacter marinus TaxID=2776705 RepID=UPI0018681F59|nr:LemA family protein [Luteolibacter marinus]
MNPSGWLWGGALVVVLISVYAWYAGMVRKRNKALQALSGIDIQLRKRFDLIPNVLKIAGRFMEHERDLMKELTELRSRAMEVYDKGDPGSVEKHLAAAAAVQPAMTNIFAAAESYPELRSSDNMLAAQHTYTEVEGHLAAARRTYNATVESLNSSIQIFPGNLIAALAGIKVMPFYEESVGAAKLPVSAGDYLG